MSCRHRRQVRNFSLVNLCGAIAKAHLACECVMYATTATKRFSHTICDAKETSGGAFELPQRTAMQ